MPTRNILTPRERRVLTTLLKAYSATLAEAALPLDQQRHVAEVVDVLEQVIDSATIPDDRWRTKYLAADAAKWNREVQ